MCRCDSKKVFNWGLLALRVAVGIVFIYHGWQKLGNIDATTQMFDMVGLPMPMVFAWLVGLVEFVGGIAVLLGMFFSIVAPLLALTMVAALLLVHTKMPYTAAELPIVLLGSVLALYATGAGKCALFRGKKDTCDCADASGDHEKCSTEDKDCCGGHCGCGDHEEHGHEEKKEHKAGM